jgi:hypothetical protein
MKIRDIKTFPVVIGRSQLIVKVETGEGGDAGGDQGQVVAVEEPRAAEEGGHRDEPGSPDDQRGAATAQWPGPGGADDRPPEAQSSGAYPQAAARVPTTASGMNQLPCPPSCVFSSRKIPFAPFSLTPPTPPPLCAVLLRRELRLSLLSPPRPKRRWRPLCPMISSKTVLSGAGPDEGALADRR